MIVALLHALVAVPAIEMGTARSPDFFDSVRRSIQIATLSLWTASALAIMSVNLLGDSIRDALEPLRGRPLQ